MSRCQQLTTIFEYYSHIWGMRPNYVRPSIMDRFWSYLVGWASPYFLIPASCSERHIAHVWKITRQHVRKDTFQNMISKNFWTNSHRLNGFSICAINICPRIPIGKALARIRYFRTKQTKTSTNLCLAKMKLFSKL